MDPVFMQITRRHIRTGTLRRMKAHQHMDSIVSSLACVHSGQLTLGLHRLQLYLLQLAAKPLCLIERFASINFAPHRRSKFAVRRGLEVFARFRKLTP